jgi:hypothetical protein
MRPAASETGTAGRCSRRSNTARGRSHKASTVRTGSTSTGCAARARVAFGWDAQVLERGELFYSRGGFVTRAAAVRWAEEERKAMEKGPS